jgi:hypothetical protein
MLGHKNRDQPELFISGPLRQLIPDEHILVRVDRVLDLSWLRGEVGSLYCVDVPSGLNREDSPEAVYEGFYRH